MPRGTLRLSNGFGATCEYELNAHGGGTLLLPAALYLPIRDSDLGTLTLEHGTTRQVRVTFGPRVGEAVIVTLD
jgi:hypothetical protein